jgi:Ulp1 family protease
MKKPAASKQWAVNRYEWLSSDDIDEVEKEYVKLFSHYHFLGCIPIDFDLKSETQDCIVSTLCAMKLTELAKKGHEQIGIVFNTDPHDGPGEHWIALFCDIRSDLEYPRITYFDSYAHAPEKEIKTLMKRWKTQWDATGKHSKPMKMTFNATRHQFKDSECGMYCLYFHRCCLMELPMQERIPDDVINGFRQMLFRVPKIEGGT